MILDTALGGTQEPDKDNGRPNGSSSEGGDVHVRHEEALREELGVERHRRLDTDEKNKRLKARTNKLRKALALLHGESTAAEAMRQQVSQLKGEILRLEAERLRRMRVERRSAGSLAALVGLLVGIVPWASGLTGSTLLVAVDACGGAFLLVGAAELIWGSPALVVCCALIGVGTSIVSTVISAYSATEQKTQTTKVSQTGSGRPAACKTTPKRHQRRVSYFHLPRMFGMLELCVGSRVGAQPPTLFQGPSVPISIERKVNHEGEGRSCACSSPRGGGRCADACIVRWRHQRGGY